jgi:hypothetical protein
MPRPTSLVFLLIDKELHHEQRVCLQRWVLLHHEGDAPPSFHDVDAPTPHPRRRPARRRLHHHERRVCLGGDGSSSTMKVTHPFLHGGGFASVTTTSLPRSWPPPSTMRDDIDAPTPLPRQRPARRRLHHHHERADSDGDGSKAQGLDLGSTC